MTNTPSSDVEIEQELKHLVSSSHSLSLVAAARSSHHIHQCYFDAGMVVFSTQEKPYSIDVAGIRLDIGMTPKQERTLVAILEQTPEPTVRLRRMDNDWYFTVKGLSMDEGTLEFEVDVAFEQARQLVIHGAQSLEKMRHLVEENGYLWEVDVYMEKLEGLLVAELENRNDLVFPPPTLPQWVGQDVANDFRYKNVNLAKMEPQDVQALLAQSGVDFTGSSSDFAPSR